MIHKLKFKHDTQEINIHIYDTWGQIYRHAEKVSFKDGKRFKHFSQNISQHFNKPSCTDSTLWYCRSVSSLLKRVFSITITPLQRGKDISYRDEFLKPTIQTIQNQHQENEEPFFSVPTFVKLLFSYIVLTILGLGGL